MNKYKILILGFILLILIGIYFIWSNLPLRIIRYNDIKLGGKVIENIEKFKATNKQLPETGDWATLERLGFKMTYLATEPYYEKLNDSVFELAFLEGFDGPYLLWNSQKRIWEIAQPTLPDKFKENKIKP